jgi:hypothetical protein
MSAARPLFPRKRTSIRDLAMSHSCHKPTHAPQQTAPLFDHLIGGHLHNQRHREAERLGRLKIDDKFELGRLLDREIGRFSPLENAIHVNRRLPELIGEIHSIRDETAAFREDTDRVDSRKSDGEPPARL